MTAERTPILKGEKKHVEKVDKVGFLELFQFSDAYDKALMLVGSVCAALAGLTLPAAIYLFGKTLGDVVNEGKVVDLLDDIPEFLKAVNLTKSEVLQEREKLGTRCNELDMFYNITTWCKDLDLEDSLSEIIKPWVRGFAYAGTSVVFNGFLQIFCWAVTCERQIYRIRYRVFKSILSQDIGWFDVSNPSEINTRLVNDVAAVQKGLGDSTGTIVMNLSTFFGGYILALATGPKLAGVLVAISPIVLMSGVIYNYLSTSSIIEQQKSYTSAGSVSEEVLSNIRTVIAFGGEEKEVKRYSDHLGKAKKHGRVKGMWHGLSLGYLQAAMMIQYAIGLWYGGRLVIDDGYDFSDVIIVFYSIATSTTFLSNVTPGIQNLSDARVAAFHIYNMIHLKSKIDGLSDLGNRPDQVHGNIRFRGIHFSYPSRPDVKVLNGLDLEMKPGQTVALVGSSGCGKSTCVQLFMRFYDPENGQIFLDGMDLKDLNIKWLRQKIGLVSQEPVLFDTTIAENIRYGCDDVTMEQIIEATRNANAFDFISKLPDKFNTLVGEGGAKLSGGQKQRIAIARALVRDPKILLLDEATSALDTESESIVQDALDKARKGRTTLVIAHRLSTIKTADIIVGIDKGVVKEKGTHKELMAIRGIYYMLVMNQTKQDKDESDTEQDEKIQFSRSFSEEEEPKMKRALSISSDTDEEKEKRVDYHNKTSCAISKLIIKVIHIFAKVTELNYKDHPEVSWGRLLKLNASEWHYLVIGGISSLLAGSVTPAVAIVFSEYIAVFQGDDGDREDAIQKWALAFTGLAVIAMAVHFLESMMFAMAGEALTERLRVASMRAMLKQEMAWFDEPRHNTGALTTRLNSDVSQVQNATGTRLGMVLRYVSGVGGALTLSMYYGWQLTLVLLSIFPILGLSTVMQQVTQKGSMGSAAMAIKEAGKIAVQASQNMRTVAALGKEKHFLDNYEQILHQLMGKHKLSSAFQAILFGTSQAVTNFSLCIIFTYGTYLVEEDEMSTVDVFKVFGFIVFCGHMVGFVMTFFPDMNKAKMAARATFALLDRVSEIDGSSTKGKIPSEETFQSSIHFKDARFSYRTRPDVEVLQGLDFRVEPGQTVALVGSSGCGKSTAISLLERFYDLGNGSVILGRKYNIRDINIRWLRSQVGLVSQEPVLFDRSIADNIAYGDNTRQVSMDEIIQAARDANIHNFIHGLPRGYDTLVGDGGTQLSGGQKQRVAIARALVRNPKILLLDEATSALDTESEKIVQEALDRARAGRTCVTIAHRLSTIQDADKIVVIHNGRSVEQGTHTELMAQEGFYNKLQTIQRA